MPDPQPAPAPSPEPKPIVTSDYLATRRAERAGEPAPTPTPEPTPDPTPTDPTPTPTARRTEPTPQDRRADDRITRRVSEAVAPLQAEIERLRSQLGTRAPEPAAPAEPKAPAWKKYREHPDAPNLADFDSIEDHAAAMAHFVGSEMLRESRETAQRDSERESLTSEQRSRADGFATRIKEATTADAAFWDSVRPEVAALKPFDALQQGEPAGPGNVVAEEVMSSPVSPQLMRHLSKPGELERLLAVPEHLKTVPRHRLAQEHTRWIVREIGKIEASLAQPPAPAAVTPKLVTDAPEPAERLGRRPAAPTNDAETALKRKDTGGYLAAKRAERAALLR